MADKLNQKPHNNNNDIRESPLNNKHRTVQHVEKEAEYVIKRSCQINQQRYTVQVAMQSSYYRNDKL